MGTQYGYGVAPNSKVLQTGTALAASANGTGYDIRGWDDISFLLAVTAAATGTLDVKIQHSWDGITWVNSGIAFTQVTTAVATETEVPTAHLGRYVRGVATIAASGVYTFELRMIGRKLGGAKGPVGEGV